MSDSPFNELESRSRRNGIPQSRHGARSELIAVPRPLAEEASETSVSTAAVASPGQSAPTTKPPRLPGSVSVDELVKTTIHLGKSDDALLNLVSYTGKGATPKVEASRSAVVRLALRRLADTMTPEQIIKELRISAVPTGTAGRPRLK